MTEGPWTGPWKWSMDPVQRGGPWTPGPCFVLTRWRWRQSTGKTRVLHFRVKNTPLKDKKWKEKVQKNAQCSFCGERGWAFNQENSTLFSSRWSAFSKQTNPCVTASVELFNQGSDVFAEFSGTFWTLWSRKLCFWKGIYVIINVL